MIHLEVYTENDVSVIICTKDRLGDLKHLFESISELVPQPCKILLADNSECGSAHELIKGFPCAMNISYFHVPTNGKCHGLNVLLDQVTTKVCFFTDDDVRVPTTWVKDMLSCLNDTGATAVQGEIHIPSEYDVFDLDDSERKHLTEVRNMHEEFKASPFLIGANMALAWHRCRDFRFDVNTGPGAMGYMDDTLLLLHLVEQNATFSYCRTPVKHYFATNRITNPLPWQLGKKHAKSSAYVHIKLNGSVPRYLIFRIVLRLLRLLLALLLLPFSTDRLLQSLTSRIFDLFYLYYMYRFFSNWKSSKNVSN
jgi:glycosyltransferase involved in cell wall biosynthesis